MQYPTTQVHPDAQLFGANDADHFSEAYRRYSDVQITTRLEEQEQLRRLADPTGEAYRKINATAVSSILPHDNDKGLYERGTEYASSLLSSSLELGKSATHFAMDAGHKVQDAAIRGVEATQDAVIKAQEMAHQGVELAQSMAEKSGISSLIHGAIDKVNDIWEDVSSTFVWAKVVELEEAERERRILSDNESRSILNAQKLSGLVKDLEIYKPAEEPNTLYGTKLLEEMERSRRVWQDTTGRTAIVNAQGVAEVVKDSVRLLKTSGHLSIPTDKDQFNAAAPRASAVSQ